MKILESDPPLHGQNNRLVLRHNDRMFKLRSDGPVHGAQGPAIFFFRDTSDAGGEERLNRQHQPFIENARIVGVMKVQDFLRTFMQFAPNAMSCQIIDDVKTGRRASFWTVRPIPLNGLPALAACSAFVNVAFVASSNFSKLRSRFETIIDAPVSA